MNGLKLFILCMTVLLLPAWICAEETPPSSWKSYQKGVDFYRQRDYDQAGDNFPKALNSADRTLEEWASYNLGNTAFKKGQASEEKDPAAALNFYQEAQEYFRRAITANYRDKDAKFNYELTAKKVKELDQKQKQSGQKQQNQQNKQKPEQNKQSAKNKLTDKEQNQQKENQQGKKQQDQDKQAENKPEEQATAKDSQGQKGQQQQMSKDEALMLLNNFQRSEEKPKALITQDKESKQTQVDKDW